jgi:hypothetical protein
MPAPNKDTVFAFLSPLIDGDYFTFPPHLQMAVIEVKPRINHDHVEMHRRGDETERCMKQKHAK